MSPPNEALQQSGSRVRRSAVGMFRHMGHSGSVIADRGQLWACRLRIMGWARGVESIRANSPGMTDSKATLTIGGDYTENHGMMTIYGIRKQTYLTIDASQVE